MKDTTVEQKKAARIEYWRERVAEQERSGRSVKQFCGERGLAEQAFYVWRKRLREQQPMRFALVEAGSAQRQAAPEGHLELVLAKGERLRIGSGVDTSLLRAVLEVLRA